MCTSVELELTYIMDEGALISDGSGSPLEATAAAVVLLSQAVSACCTKPALVPPAQLPA